MSFWRRLRGWVWPHIGWNRAGLYLWHRMTRLPGSPHSIAAGFACGAGISFTPFIGFHIALAVLLSFFVRGNYLAAAIGTVVGNPWTFPFIWVAAYELGHFLLGTTPAPLPPLDHISLGLLLDNLRAILWPMTIGGVPLGLAAGLAFYFPMVRLVAAYQAARRHRRERRRLGHQQAEIEHLKAPAKAR